jgi:hypothetical protein
MLAQTQLTVTFCPFAVLMGAYEKQRGTTANPGSHPDAIELTCAVDLFIITDKPA